jgi:hypothetical protein
MLEVLMKKICSPHSVRNLDLFDLILMDSALINEGVNEFDDAGPEQQLKLALSRRLVEIFLHHFRALGAVLKNSSYKDQHLNGGWFNLCQAHGDLYFRIRKMKLKIAYARVLDHEVEREWEILMAAVLNHLKREKIEIIPLLRQSLSEQRLKEVSALFFKERKITSQQLAGRLHFNLGTLNQVRSGFKH